MKRRKSKQPPVDAGYHRFDDIDTLGATIHGPIVGAAGNKSNGGPTGGSTGPRQRVTNPDADIVLDVQPLLHYRLELKDLHVTSDKPLASGAFGEVWLGTYGNQQVAIKRMKNHSARMAQKFIDEIVLMSQYDHHTLTARIVQCSIQYS